MKVKTAELTGPALDWAVAKCEGLEVYVPAFAEKPWLQYRDCHGQPHMCPKYSTDRAFTGSIIEREQIKVVKGNPLYSPRGNEKGDHYEPLWIASVDSGRSSHGRSYLEAAMRCYVASKLGDEVDVPEELL